MSMSRRSFLKTSAAATVAAQCPARWVDAGEIAPGTPLKLRFAVASDLHYGQPDTPFETFSEDLVGWMNKEKRDKGLDALFLNGDLTHDSSASLLALRDKHLSKLEVPFHTIKGNHDFVDGTPGSPTQSWETLWGYPCNHTVKIGDCAFVMADTSAPAQADKFLAADLGWLKGQLEAHRDATAIFVLIHIQQRRHQFQGWPQHGVSEPSEVPKAEAVMALLESTPNVRAVFHGHNHDQTGVHVSGGRRYFFDSHTGGNWGAKRGYRIVEVYEDNAMLSYQTNAEDGVELNRDELRD